MGGHVRSVLVVAAVLQFHTSIRSATAADPSTCACRQQNGWTIIETDNFSVWSRLPQTDTRQLASRCETLRTSMVRSWNGDGDWALWRPKCAVVVHEDLGQYQHAVDCGRNPSVGCTTVTVDGGRTVFRRIDLRADAADWSRNALPHELTHVVLADRFPGRTLPGWLNEGLAMTAEAPELQERRLHVLETAHDTGGLPALKHVLHNGPAAARLDTDLYYAVSFSLIDFLREEGGTPQLLQFVESALDDGYPVALRETYGIRGGVDELEQRWLDETLSARRSTNLAAR
jgi:Peptidase MA superfamily